MSESMTERTTNKHLRPILKDLLSQCTEKQQATFARMYGSVEAMPFAKVPMAIHQCETTLVALKGGVE